MMVILFMADCVHIVSFLCKYVCKQVFVRCPLHYGVLDGLMSLLSHTLAQVNTISFIVS